MPPHSRVLFLYIVRSMAVYQPTVLVSYIPYSYISHLQTKLGHREGHEARRIGLEAMPLHQHIEGGHGERQPGVKIRPAPMHHLIEMALRHEVARLIVWHVVSTRPVV